MKNILIAVVVVVVVAGAGFLLLKSTSKNTTTNTSTSSSTQNAGNNSSNSEETQGSTITYKSGVFSPSTLTVKSGGSVTIVNESSDVIEFNSDPHPTHTTNSQLNVGAVAAGETKTFTLTKTGSWGYHNHLESSERGTIVVQ